jgi:hypothetical protein
MRIDPVKLKLILLMSLACLAMLLAVPPDTAMAQTVQNDSLHPRTYGWAVRVPWFNGVASARIAHSDTVAAADTLTMTGLTATSKLLFTRLAPPKKAVTPPTITVAANKVIVSFDVADTLTYSILVDRKP